MDQDPRLVPHSPDFRPAYRNARVLLLGASGFIGRWVARALCEAGADLVAVVRSRDTAARVLTQWGVAATLFECDLASDRSLLSVCRSVEPSITFNLAGYGVDPSERDHETAYTTNAQLVERLARLLAGDADPRWPGQHLIHAGSALEYGDVAGVITEATIPNPTTLYGRSKLQGTKALEAFCRRFSLRAVTARLFMVYGSGEHEGRLLPQLFRAAKDGAAVPLTAGKQRRDFTYVEDVAEGLLRLGLSSAPGGTIVNLNTGRLTRVREVIEVAARQLGIPPERLLFGSLPTRTEEMSQVTGVSNVRLGELTGWTPSTGVPEGVRRMLRRERELADGARIVSGGVDSV